MRTTKGKEREPTNAKNDTQRGESEQAQGNKTSTLKEKLCTYPGTKIDTRSKLSERVHLNIANHGKEARVTEGCLVFHIFRGLYA